MGIILIIIFIAIAAALGSSKGYSGVLCGVAGCFGGLIAIIVITLLGRLDALRGVFSVESL